MREELAEHLTLLTAEHLRAGLTLLGADRGVILRMVFASGARIAAIGLGIGIAGALALTRVLSGLPQSGNSSSEKSHLRRRADWHDRRPAPRRPGHCRAARLHRTRRLQLGPLTDD